MTSFITPHCISAFIVHKTPEGPLYLLIRRAGKYLPGTWQMVSGGILEGETASQAAAREIQEETGLSPLKIYCADAVETFYMQSLDKITCIPVFVAFVKETDVTLSPSEHDAYEWLPFEEAKKRLVWSEQRRVITQIHETCVLQIPNDLLLADLSFLPEKKQITSRTGVYAVVLQDEKLLVVQQKKGPYRGKFDLPGGKIEPGETIESALKRELLEEVAMTFETMHLLDHFTVTVDAVHDHGTSYLFHQIGLIYRIDHVSRLPNHTPEMDYFWMPLELLSKDVASPFVMQTLCRK